MFVNVLQLLVAIVAVDGNGDSVQNTDESHIEAIEIVNECKKFIDNKKYNKININNVNDLTEKFINNDSSSGVELTSIKEKFSIFYGKKAVKSVVESGYVDNARQMTKICSVIFLGKSQTLFDTVKEEIGRSLSMDWSQGLYTNYINYGKARQVNISYHYLDKKIIVTFSRR